MCFVLDAVTVRYRTENALDRVSIGISNGDTVAVVGPSGAGKSTLLRLLNGSIRPTTGTVSISGCRVADLTAPQLRRIRSSIGFIHQDLRLVPNLRVVQNVVAGRLGNWSLLRSMRAMFWTPQHLVEEAYAILERVGIGDKLFERTDRLSGGQRQRVAIARALFQHPIALVADEPVSSVDPNRARDTVRLLAEISRERGITLCVSLHNLELARAYFPRIVGMRDGRVFFDSLTAELSMSEFDALYRLETTELALDCA